MKKIIYLLSVALFVESSLEADETFLRIADLWKDIEEFKTIFSKAASSAGSVHRSSKKDALITFSVTVNTEAIFRTFKEIGIGLGAGFGSVDWTKEPGVFHKTGRATGGEFELKFGGCPLNEEPDGGDSSEDNAIFKALGDFLSRSCGAKVSARYPREIFHAFGSGAAFVQDRYLANPPTCNAKDQTIGIASGNYTDYVNATGIKFGLGRGYGCAEGQGTGEGYCKTITGEGEMNADAIGIVVGLGNAEDLAKFLDWRNSKTF